MADGDSRIPQDGRSRALVAAARGRDGQGLGDRMHGKAGRLLARFRYTGAQDNLKPYLAEAEAMLAGMVDEVCHAAGGECGPIARSALHTAALQKALGVFLAAEGVKATEQKDRLQLCRAGSALLDCSRQNSLAALDLAVRIARNAPVVPGDPLAAFDVKPEPDE